MEEVAASMDVSAGLELASHDIEKAYPGVAERLLGRCWNAGITIFSLLKVLKKLHGGTCYQVGVHGVYRRLCYGKGVSRRLPL